MGDGRPCGAGEQMAKKRYYISVDFGASAVAVTLVAGTS
jgi:hypothetical protein